MLDDIGEAFFRENLFPQIGGLVATHIWRVALAVVEKNTVFEGEFEFDSSGHKKAAEVQSEPSGIGCVDFLKIPFLHLAHGEVNGPRGEGHVGEGRVGAAGGNHGGAVGAEDILRAPNLVVLVEDGFLG